MGGGACPCAPPPLATSLKIIEDSYQQPQDVQLISQTPVSPTTSTQQLAMSGERLRQMDSNLTTATSAINALLPIDSMNPQ